MKRTTWKLLLPSLIVAFVFSALQCSRSSISTINVVIKKTRSMMAAGDFTCFAVNVVGPGINSLSASTGAPNFSSYFNGNTCTYPGIGSALVAVTGSAQEITVRVPAGKDRLIQVIGIESPNGCQDVRNFAEIFRDVLAGTETSTNFPTIAEVGRARLDLLPGQDDTRVSIESAYTSSQKNMLTCAGSSSSTGGLTVTPSDLAIHTGGTVKFSASGGSGNYSFSLGASPASTVLSDGTYTAQTITVNSTVTETLTVTDTSTNEVVTRNITIYDPRLMSSKPIVWLRGETFSPTTVATWPNSVSSPLPLFSTLSAQIAAHNPTQVIDNDLRGFSVVTFTQGSSAINRMQATIGGSGRTMTRTDVYVVEKRTDLSDTTTTGAMLCFAESTSCLNSSSNNFSLFTAFTGGSTFLIGNAFQNPAGGTNFAANVPVSVSSLYRIHRMNLSFASVGSGLTYQVTNGSSVTASPAPNPGTLTIVPGTAMFFLGYDGSTAALTDSTKRYAGSIAEVLIFDDALSPSEDATVLNYLKLKYGLTF